MKVKVFEVGVRDGLQNEKTQVSTQQKRALLSGLVSAGIRDLELGAFVRPDKVPQMADTDALYQSAEAKAALKKGVHLWALVPNLKGMERAISQNVTHIALFTAASETFNQKNIGMSIRDSLEVMREIRNVNPKLKFRVYVSTAFACPFEGKIPPKNVLKLMDSILDLRPHEISIGDTIGMATPKDVDQLLPRVIQMIGKSKTAVHFHDTRGTALANALRALEHGVRTIDSSVGGLGGCPFAPGATGNLATEDLVFMLEGMGIQTGIDLKRLCQVSLEFSRPFNRPLSSRYLAAFQAQCELQPKKSL